MEGFLALVVISSYIGVPILAKGKDKNPFLYLLFALLIGPIAFIPLLLSSKKKYEPKVEFGRTTSNSPEPKSSEGTHSVTDARLSICPSCQSRLKKIPGAKTKCPTCKKFMYVRTDSKTMSRVVVSASKAQEIDDEWAKINGTWEGLQQERERFSKSKSELSVQFGSEASDADVKWRLLNEDLLVHSAMQNWGLYRNTVFQMSEQLRKESKIESALEKLLLVCYIDTCGPNNISTPFGKNHEFGQLPFTKESSFVAPGIIRRVEKLARKGNYDMQKLESTFNNLESKYKDSIPFTQGVKKSWEQIKKEITLS